jgi:hypothetical protein
MEYRLKENCIYCFRPIGKKTKGHIISKCIRGTLTFPLACERHNNWLGGTVESQVRKDYWVNFAKTRLGLEGLKIDPSFTPKFRLNRYSVSALPDGRKRIVPPITDRTTWRILAKYAYETAAFFIGDDIFLPAFDGYRSFILTGEPDLAEKEMFRLCYDLPWVAGHVIEFSPSESSFAVIVRLFNAYVFKSVFQHKLGDPPLCAAQIVMDLDGKRTDFRKLSADGETWEHLGGYGGNREPSKGLKAKP